MCWELAISANEGLSLVSSPTGVMAPVPIGFFKASRMCLSAANALIFSDMTFASCYSDEAFAGGKAHNPNLISCSPTSRL